jgi:hypothetical protein
MSWFSISGGASSSCICCWNIFATAVLASVVAGHRPSTGEVHDSVVRMQAEEAFHVTLRDRLSCAPGDLLVGMCHEPLLSSVGSSVDLVVQWLALRVGLE